MKAEKKVIAHLNKCYAVAEFDYDRERHLVCAAEKEDPCYIFNYEGEKVDTLWEGPGGVMTLLQYPLTGESDPILMATQQFYSPNNSANAKIVYYTREDGQWNCHVLCDLPFVHRFGIVDRDGRYFLVACTLKSAHAFKDDWTCPGRIWVADLPQNIREYSAEHQLKMTPLVSGLYKNHGFAKFTENDYSFVLVGTENGIYKIAPPYKEGEWSAENILAVPASDMLYQDYDGDGKCELLILSPFHGDTLSVYKETDGNFECVYTLDKRMPFLHAVWGQNIGGKEFAFIGNRQEDRELIAVSWQDGTYKTEILDQGAGPANCMYFRDGEKDRLIAANRETDEVALYTLIP